MAVTAETLAVAADVRRRLRSLTDAQVVALTRAWVDAWDVLAPEFTDTLVEILTGEQMVSRATMAKHKRLTAALRQARGMLDELAATVNATVTADVADAVLDAAQAQVLAGATQLPAGAAAAGVSFELPATAALDAIVARTTEQIHSATRPLPAGVERAMKQELIRGVAVGANPRATAQRIVRRTEGRFNGGLARAATIARTETLDAHRAGHLAAAKANADLLTSWRWLATLDARTCPSCLAQHGSEHPVDEAGPLDHQNGRCARVDKTKTWRELGFDLDEPDDEFPDARAWFDGLTHETQQQIMGPQRLKLLRDGDIGWDDLTTKRTTPGWRDSYGVTPVRDLA